MSNALQGWHCGSGIKDIRAIHPTTKVTGILAFLIKLLPTTGLLPVMGSFVFIMQESRISPALSSMCPQTHTPISIYSIQQSPKKFKA